MADGPSEYTLDPTRIRASGEESVEGTVISANITDTGLQITVRTGAISSRDISLPYNEIDAVKSVEELSHSLVIESGGTEYVLMNITIDDNRITEIVDAIQRGIRRGQTQRSGSRSSDRSGSRSSDRSGSRSSDRSESRSSDRSESRSSDRSESRSSDRSGSRSSDRSESSRSDRSESRSSDPSEQTPEGNDDTAGERGDSGETATTDESSQSAADELKKWVDLYEQGIISEDELAEKKRELL